MLTGVDFRQHRRRPHVIHDTLEQHEVVIAAAAPPLQGESYSQGKKAAAGSETLM